MNNPTRIALDIARRVLGEGGPRGTQHENILRHIDARQPLSRDANELSSVAESGWDRLADSVARVGGSWPFIGGFFLFLALWVGGNTLLLASAKPFDPYPFIFLNLILSMLAAIQAPIIMMSQNRQAEKDRVAAAHDYEVNLRSEIEILAMQQKLDRLRGEQHELILARQARMLEMLEALLVKSERG
ncbi:DUF1003 domain-containing protein [Alteraurantiacibacter aestuarii]|uniref:DUF1003 domain-containing protein n=1 Tax=Alteraurantiacibacter aestuarii TaxID=650004 RepID=A0A844ZID7_9SPHN|nr:DUF1003 domain-containing protein [Alteraurantiacibacter aestuarii]MXO87548.1 DUF1003 domain-containing protein [Alteraurantiacibacter aestuarii]